MANDFSFVQAQPFSLSGAGAIAGATTINLKTFTGIDGAFLTMADFGGTIGYGTLEPGNGNLEEQISFSGVVQNANGTATLTGVSNVLFVSPYTETSGLAKTHAGSTTFVISNTSGFYNKLDSKDDDATITGVYTFVDPSVPRMNTEPAYGAGSELFFATKEYVDGVVVSGAPDASTTQKGIVQEATQAQVDARTAAGSTSARLFINPSTLRATKYSDFEDDTGAANAYVINPTPAISSYQDGQVFSFEAAHANTGGSTLNVSGLGTKDIKKGDGSIPLDPGDILAGMLVFVEKYSGLGQDVFQMLNPPATALLAETFVTDTGAANAYVASIQPVGGGYFVGMNIHLKIANSSTGASTLNVSSLGAQTIKKLDGSTDITKGDLIAGNTYQFTYDGTNFVCNVPLQKSSGILSAASNSGGHAITTGFKPRTIRFSWQYPPMSTDITVPFSGQGTWNQGSYAEIFAKNTNTSGSILALALTSDTSAVVSGAAASDTGAFTGAVGTLTDTGFTLTLANSTGATPTVTILWEAES